MSNLKFETFRTKAVYIIRLRPLRNLVENHVELSKFCESQK